MFRTSDIVLIAVMVSAAAYTYQSKHEAENKLDEVRRLESQIRYEEDVIDTLKADWSVLTQPSRLQKLSEIYAAELQLQPIEALQIVGMNALPERKLSIENLTAEDEIGLTDQTQTGAIDQ